MGRHWIPNSRQRRCRNQSDFRMKRLHRRNRRQGRGASRCKNRDWFGDRIRSGNRGEVTSTADKARVVVNRGEREGRVGGA